MFVGYRETATAATNIYILYKVQYYWLRSKKWNKINVCIVVAWILINNILYHVSFASHPVLSKILKHLSAPSGHLLQSSSPPSACRTKVSTCLIMCFLMKELSEHLYVKQPPAPCCPAVTQVSQSLKVGVIPGGKGTDDGAVGGRITAEPSGTVRGSQAEQRHQQESLSQSSQHSEFCTELQRSRV